MADSRLGIFGDGIERADNKRERERLLCEKHKRFPCRECGTKHYPECECYFCKPINPPNR